MGQRFAGLASYEVSLLDLSGLWPNWHHSVGGVEVGATLPSYGYDASGWFSMFQPPVIRRLASWKDKPRTWTKKSMALSARLLPTPGDG